MKEPQPTKEEIAKKIEEEVQANIPIVRPILENNLFKFNRMILKVEEGKGNAPLAPFHQEMCTFIEKNKRKKKLLLVPRSHLKSTVVTVGYSLQQLLSNPTIRILIANATYDLACSFLTDIKRQLKFNENIHLIWGDLSKNPEKWSENEIMLGGIKHGKKEPNITAMGLESNLTSQHYDLIIFDDLVNEKSVNTQEQIEKTIRFYKEALNLLEPNGQLIVIGTRWRDNDLYGWVMDKDNQVISDFEVMVRQAYEGILEDNPTILFPGKFDAKHLSRLRAQQGPWVFCTPKETPILMADFTEKPISKIKEGDEIIGFIRNKGKLKNRLVKTKVKKVFNREDYVFDLKMESGNRVRCTKEHRWYTNRGDKTHQMYLPPKVGRKLMFVCPTQYIKSKNKLEKNNDWEKEYWSYLGGMFDGEGSALSSALTITQGIKNKGVCAKIRQVLNGLNIPFTEFYRDNSDREKWGDSIIFCLKDNFNTSIRMIRNMNFAKKWQVVKRLLKRSSSFIKSKDRIIWMKKGDKKEEVFALETETGNYIAWGYASSNSAQYMNECIPSEDADFKREWFQYFEYADLRGKPMNKFTMIDPALSEEKKADFTAIVTVGLDNFSNIYVLDVRRLQGKPDKVIDEIFKVWEQWHPIYMGIEEVAFQKALRYALHQEMNKRMKWLPLKEVKPEGRAKDQRIRGLQPLYANRKVFHNKSMINTVYLEDELLRFPLGKHDDIIDSFAYGLDFWHPGRQKVSHHGGKRYLYA